MMSEYMVKKGECTNLSFFLRELNPKEFNVFLWELKERLAFLYIRSNFYH